MRTFSQALIDYTVERIRALLRLDDVQDEPCDFCSERIGDHSEDMLWRCQRGE